MPPLRLVTADGEDEKAATEEMAAAAARMVRIDFIVVAAVEIQEGIVGTQV